MEKVIKREAGWTSGPDVTRSGHRTANDHRPISPNTVDAILAEARRRTTSSNLVSLPPLAFEESILVVARAVGATERLAVKRAMRRQVVAGKNKGDCIRKVELPSTPNAEETPIFYRPALAAPDTIVVHHYDASTLNSCLSMDSFSIHENHIPVDDSPNDNKTTLYEAMMNICASPNERQSF